MDTDNILTMPLLPYQAEGLNKIYEFDGRALIADDTGLGKTAQSLAYAESNQDIKTVLIMCPSKLMDNWKIEICKLVKNSIGNVGIAKDSLLVDRCKYTIMSYERMPNIRTRLAIKGKYPHGLKVDLVILDELHNIKNFETKKGSCAKHAASLGKHVIGLSATPLINCITELIDVVSLINKDIVMKLYAGRLIDYTNKKTGEHKVIPYFSEAGAILQKYVVIRRTKEEAGLTELLPVVHREFVKVEISNRDEYTECSNNFLDYAMKHGIEIMTKNFTINEGSKRINKLRSLVAHGKLNALCYKIDDFLADDRFKDDKMLIYFEHTEILNMALERYKDIAIKIDGTVPISQRAKLISRFNEDDNIRLMFGNNRAAGEGLNGLTIANHILVHELSWTSVLHEQVEGRENRIGQKKKDVYFRYLIADKTVDVELLRRLDVKQFFAKETFDYLVYDKTAYEDALNDFQLEVKLKTKAEIIVEEKMKAYDAKMLEEKMKYHVEPKTGAEQCWSLFLAGLPLILLIISFFIF